MHENTYSGEYCLSYDGFRNKIENGRTFQPSNNMWVRCIFPTEALQAEFPGHFQGTAIMQMIQKNNKNDADEFEKLAREWSAVICPRYKNDSVWDYVFSEEANKKLYSMYVIATRNGIGHDRLFR